ncbi:hypothetical protein NUM3379_22760 [Kineococcus sp. NUM-3379]
MSLRSALAVPATVAALLLALPTAATAAPADRGYTITTPGVFPEGIAADRTHVYVTSKADGTVYRGELGAEQLQPFLPGGRDGRTTATGVESTGDRLLVAGAETGRLFLHDTRTGALVATYTVPDTGQAAFLNDIAVTRDGDAYITDSQRPVVYRIPAAELTGAPTGAPRTLQAAIALPADSQSPGFSMNGIVATPDGKALLLINMTSGALYRVDLGTGTTEQVALDVALVNGDGLELRGNTLYVARNADNLISTVRLSGDFRSGTVTDEATYEGADFPTTLALSRGRLLVVNSQFDTFFGGAPQTSPVFTISSVRPEELRSTR